MKSLIRFASLAALLVAPVLGVHACAPSPAAAPAAPGPAQSVDAALIRELDGVLRQRAAADSFSGVVLLARGGEPVYRYRHGVADRATGAPVDFDTRFNLGSVDKFFTRIAIWQLAQAGQLSTGDLVGRHLPEYPNERVRNEVTIHHLLTMRSGVGDIFNERWARNRLRLRTVDDYLALFAGDPLLFDPGTEARYSNGGYVVLGKIVERVSGLGWDAYVRRNVFGPAGMERTGYFEQGSATPGLAVGYTTEPAPWVLSADDTVTSAQRRPNAHALPLRGSSAGGGYSTANDLFRLARALRENRLLSEAYTDSLLGPTFRVPPTGELRSGGWIGGSPGVNAVFSLFSTGHTLIILSNYDPPSAEAVRRPFVERLRASVAAR